MHTGPMSELDGKFDAPAVAERPCPKCGGVVHYRVWESSDGAYEDVKYTCQICPHSWWVEGSDA